MNATLAVVATLLATSTVACASPRIHHPRVHRTPVVFESANAQERFAEALDDRYADGAADFAGGRLSRNAFFNHQVPLADTDQDGILTEREVASYVRGHDVVDVEGRTARR